MGYCICQYFRGFGLIAEIHEGLILQYSDVFITINRHILKWKCLRGVTREIRENINNHVYSIAIFLNSFLKRKVKTGFDLRWSVYFGSVNLINTAIK